MFAGFLKKELTFDFDKVCLEFKREREVSLQTKINECFTRKDSASILALWDGIFNPDDEMPYNANQWIFKNSKLSDLDRHGGNRVVVFDENTIKEVLAEDPIPSVCLLRGLQLLKHAHESKEEKNRQENLDQAKKMMEQSQSNYGLGLYYWEIGNISEARKCFEKGAKPPKGQAPDPFCCAKLGWHFYSKKCWQIYAHSNLKKAEKYTKIAAQYGIYDAMRLFLQLYHISNLDERDGRHVCLQTLSATLSFQQNLIEVFTQNTAYALNTHWQALCHKYPPIKSDKVEKGLRKLLVGSSVITLVQLQSVLERLANLSGKNIQQELLIVLNQLKEQLRLQRDATKMTSDVAIAEDETTDDDSSALLPGNLISDDEAEPMYPVVGNNGYYRVLSYDSAGDEKSLTEVAKESGSSPKKMNPDDPLEKEVDKILTALADSKLVNQHASVWSSIKKEDTRKAEQILINRAKNSPSQAIYMALGFLYTTRENFHKGMRCWLYAYHLSSERSLFHVPKSDKAHIEKHYDYLRGILGLIDVAPGIVVIDHLRSFLHSRDDFATPELREKVRDHLISSVSLIKRASTPVQIKESKVETSKSAVNIVSVYPSLSSATTSAKSPTQQSYTTIVQAIPATPQLESKREEAIDAACVDSVSFNLSSDSVSANTVTAMKSQKSNANAETNTASESITMKKTGEIVQPTPTSKSWYNFHQPSALNVYPNLSTPLPSEVLTNPGKPKEVVTIVSDTTNSKRPVTKNLGASAVEPEKVVKVVSEATEESLSTSKPAVTKLVEIPSSYRTKVKTFA